MNSTTRNLLAEVNSVISETGLRPRELAEQREELRCVLKEISIVLSLDPERYEVEIAAIEETLKRNKTKKKWSKS